MKYFSKSLKSSRLIKMDNIHHEAKIINGIKLSEHIASTLKGYLEEKKIILGKLYRAPVLKIILVGEDPSSQIYIKNKLKQCELIGIEGQFLQFNSEIKKEVLIEEIEKSNKDKSIDALIIQLPLPKQLDAFEILSILSPDKDVDCLTPYNQGIYYQSLDHNKIIIPPTALGIIEILKLILNFKNDLNLLKENEAKKLSLPLDLSGFDIKVLGRGLTSGLPISCILQKYNGTVTICHSKTLNVKKYCLEADILVCAIGKPKFIGKDMIKDGAIVIDVGINSIVVDDKKEVVGDVHMNEVIDKVKFITPVPGGVGRLTVVMLMKNVVKIWEKNLKK